MLRPLVATYRATDYKPPIRLSADEVSMLLKQHFEPIAALCHCKELEEALKHGISPNHTHSCRAADP